MVNALSGCNEYSANVQQIALFQKYGPLGIKVVGKDFFARSWLDRIRVYVSVFIAVIFRCKSFDFKPMLELAKCKVEEINQVHNEMTIDSPLAKTYLASGAVFKSWNGNKGFSESSKFQRWAMSSLSPEWNAQFKEGLQINYSNGISTTTSLSSDNISCSYLNVQKLPLTISLSEENQLLTDSLSWIETHRNDIKEQLTCHGAVLFRGLAVKSPADFAGVVEAALGKKPLDYRGGEGSRDKVEEGVYTSTKAPSNFTIPLHHELSCTRNPPANICFYCDVEPAEGTGQTTLGSTHRITEAIKNDPVLWYQFKGKKIKYISRHPPQGSMFNRINKTHKTWQEVFETNDKQEVERICQKKKFAYKWDGDWIEVTRLAPATRTDSKRNAYWHNQAHLYDANPRLRGGWVNHILANIVYCRPSTRMYDVEFQDGTKIPRTDFYKIYDILDKETVKFDWKKGDVLIIDNKSSKGAMHGRASYEGERRILTSMVM
jgi:alpha-ketoglutarate-dependent taurine dioxygenase